MANELNLKIDLWPRQLEALETEASELLFGGASEGGKSHFIRVALIAWCLAIPGLQCVLVRKKYEDILRNHVYGPSGFTSLLAPLIEHKCAEVTQREIRFANGSIIAFQHCFTGDTEILTSEGPRQLRELIGQTGLVNVGRDKHLPFRNVRLTRRQAPIVKLAFNDGSEVRCTGDHLFFTDKGKVEAKNLQGKICLTNQSSFTAIQSKNFKASGINLKGNTNQQKHALSNASEPLDCKECIAVEDAGCEDVYCLTVPEAGFFALSNSIIVSNCQDERQFSSAQGVEKHVLIIDEATQLSERLIRFFRGWVRMSKEMQATLPAQFKGKFPKIIYTANPIGVSVGFFRREFVKARPAFYIEEVEGFKRQYIPSRAVDNPSVDLEAHKGRLAGIGDAAIAKALAEGDWDAPVGDFFPEYDESRHVIPDVDIPNHWFRFRTFDWGTREPFAVHWWAVADGVTPIEYQGHKLWIPAGAYVVYREWYGCNEDKPAEGLALRNEDMATGILQRSTDIDTKVVTLTDRLPFQDRGGVTIAETFFKCGVPLMLADCSRVPGWSQLRSRLIGKLVDTNDKRPTPMIFLTASCRWAREYLPALSRHPTKGEDAVESGEATHVCDSLRMGAMARARIKELDKVTPSLSELNDSLTFDQAIKHVQQHKALSSGPIF